jgi:hypothetical protein
MKTCLEDILHGLAVAAYTGFSGNNLDLGGQVETKSGQQREEPGDGLVLVLPIIAMATLIGILALLMRSTGKW